jgi:hypothetical protein
MRGSAKRLQPILSESIQALIDECDDTTVGALTRWYAKAYGAMTDAREAADGPDATYTDLAAAVRYAELPPLPPALEGEKGRLAVAVARSSAVAMILGDTRKTLAGRALKREHRLREAARTAEAVAAASAESAVELHALADEEEADACPPCPTDKKDKADKKDKRDRFPLSKSPSFESPKTSKINQSTRARAKARGAPASSSAWMNPYNLDGRDPVDLALEFTGERSDDARARACWGAHLRRLGPRAFCEALHVFTIDAQTGRLKNRAAALNQYLGGLTP